MGVGETGVGEMAPIHRKQGGSLGTRLNYDCCSCVLCSTWTVLSPEQLEKTLSNWRKTIDEGKADDFIRKCEEHRMRIGCATSAVGYK